MNEGDWTSSSGSNYQSQCFVRFKDFVRNQADYVNPNAVVSMYEQYKIQYRKTKLVELISKYYKRISINPLFCVTALQDYIVRTRQQCFSNLKNFTADLNESTYNKLALIILKEQIKLEMGSFSTLTDFPLQSVVAVPEDIVRNIIRSNPSPDNTNTILVKNVCHRLVKGDLEQFLSGIQGYVSFVAVPAVFSRENFEQVSKLIEKDIQDIPSEEIPQLEAQVKNLYYREIARTEQDNAQAIYAPKYYVWIKFDSSEAANAAMEQLASAVINKTPLGKPQMLASIEGDQPVTLVPDFPSEEALQEALQQATAVLEKLGAFFDHVTISETRFAEDVKETNSVNGVEELEAAPVEDIPADEIADQVENGDDAIVEENPNKSESVVKVGGVVNELLEALRTSEYSDSEKFDIIVTCMRVVFSFEFFSCRWCFNEYEYYQLYGSAVLRCPDLPPNPSRVTKAVNIRIQNFTNFNLSVLSDPIDDNHWQVAALWSAFCEKNIVPESSERFMCAICNKLFRGAEFVQKHISNKHSDMLQGFKDQISATFAAKSVELDYLAPLLIYNELLNFVSRRRRPHGPGRYDESVLNPARRPVTSAPFVPVDWDAPVSLNKNTIVNNRVNRFRNL